MECPVSLALLWVQSELIVVFRKHAYVGFAQYVRTASLNTTRLCRPTQLRLGSCSATLHHPERASRRSEPSTIG